MTYNIIKSGNVYIVIDDKNYVYRRTYNREEAYEVMTVLREDKGYAEELKKSIEEKKKRLREKQVTHTRVMKRPHKFIKKRISVSHKKRSATRGGFWGNLFGNSFNDSIGTSQNRRRGRSSGNFNMEKALNNLLK